MNTKCTFLLLFLGVTAHLSAQKEFNPDKQLAELTGKKENIGITAGYSIDDEIKWTSAKGFICEDNEIPFSTKTVTRIASIAKSFTAVAITQLVEQGQIELDAPVQKYLKNLPEDKKLITVKQLLAHTSGIPQYKGRKEIANKIHYNTLQDAMNVFIARPLLFEPGTKYFYTTYGYVILGRVIEEVSGLSYQAYMKENIFQIAEMNNTDVERVNEDYTNKSCLFHNNGRKVKEGKQNDLSNRIPGGGYVSTLEDLIKFGNALLGGKLILPESLENMLETQPVEYDGNKYGLGWYMYGTPPDENLVFGHSGGQTGCTSQLMIVPSTKTVIVVLSNTSGTYPAIATFASNLIGYSRSRTE